MRTGTIEYNDADDPTLCRLGRSHSRTSRRCSLDPSSFPSAVSDCPDAVSSLFCLVPVQLPAQSRSALSQGMPHLNPDLIHLIIETALRTSISAERPGLARSISLVCRATRDCGQGELYRMVAIGNCGRESSPAKVQAVVEQPRLGRMVRYLFWGFLRRVPLSEKYDREYEVDYDTDRERWGSFSRVCCRLEQFEVRGLKAEDIVWTVGAICRSGSSRTVSRITISEPQTTLTAGQHCTLTDYLSLFSPLHFLDLSSLCLMSSNEPASRESQRRLRLGTSFNTTSEPPISELSHPPHAIPPLLAAISPDHLEGAAVSCSMRSTVYLDWLRLASFPALTGLSIYISSDAPHLLFPLLTPALASLDSLRSFDLHIQYSLDSVLDPVPCTHKRDLEALATFFSTLPSSLRRFGSDYLIDTSSINLPAFLSDLVVPDCLASISVRQLCDKKYLAVTRVSPQAMWVIEQ